MFENFKLAHLKKDNSEFLGLINCKILFKFKFKFYNVKINKQTMLTNERRRKGIITFARQVILSSEKPLIKEI